MLLARVSYRVTLDDCPEGSCTETDVNDFNLIGASCVITNGKCKIKTTLTAAPSGRSCAGAGCTRRCTES